MGSIKNSVCTLRYELYSSVVTLRYYGKVVAIFLKGRVQKNISNTKGGPIFS